MYNTYRFLEQKAQIESRRLFSEETKLIQWMKEQKDIAYLPKVDRFGYYCPMCNDILKEKSNCNYCKQKIDWEE